MTITAAPLRRLRVLMFVAACMACMSSMAAGADATAGAPPAVSAADKPAGLPAHLPLKRDPADASEGSPWVMLLVLLGLSAGAGWLVLRQRGAESLLRAWRVPKAKAGIERIGSEVLTPQASVHVLRWQDEDLLLACTATQVTLLSRRPVPTDSAKLP